MRTGKTEEEREERVGTEEERAFFVMLSMSRGEERICRVLLVASRKASIATPLPPNDQSRDHMISVR
jgi:hypothetical protein